VLVGRVEGVARLPLLCLRAPVLRGREKLVAVDCEDDGRVAEEPAVEGRDSGTSLAMVCESEKRVFDFGCCFCGDQM
jgi:hypothetical protein